ncbi:uncharacterized protein LOC135210495 [Macrobrachium nipponense]|uniref:uncharacterized protein LOC135210495 n=1 Tax=Macrobrachium nipponense TaxID=159736 RepID=UPI0030C7D9DE
MKLFLGGLLLIATAALVCSFELRADPRAKRQAAPDDTADVKNDTAAVERACNVMTRPHAKVVGAFAPTCARQNNFDIPGALVTGLVISPQSQNGSDYMQDVLSDLEIPAAKRANMTDCLIPKLAQKAQNFIDYQRSAGHITLSVAASDLKDSFESCKQNNGTAIFECYEKACVSSLVSALDNLITW